MKWLGIFVFSLNLYAAETPTSVRIGYDSDPISFDWQESYDLTSMPLMNAIMDGLTRYQDVNGTMQIKPMLAES